jgi:hypothetical protein
VAAADVNPVEADHGYSVESVCGVEPEVPTESDVADALGFSAISGFEAWSVKGTWFEESDPCRE